MPTRKRAAAATKKVVAKKEEVAKAEVKKTGKRGRPVTKPPKIKVKNIKVLQSGNILTLKIDMSKDFGIGVSGKSRCIATSGAKEAFQFNGKDYAMIVNVFEPVKQK